MWPKSLCPQKAGFFTHFPTISQADPPPVPQMVVPSAKCQVCQFASPTPQSTLQTHNLACPAYLFSSCHSRSFSPSPQISPMAHFPTSFCLPKSSVSLLLNPLFPSRLQKIKTTTTTTTSTSTSIIHLYCHIFLST